MRGGGARRAAARPRPMRLKVGIIGMGGYARTLHTTVQILLLGALGGAPPAHGVGQLPPDGVTATRGSPWWPVKDDRPQDAECSGGDGATGWRIVITGSSPGCANASVAACDGATVALSALGFLCSSDDVAPAYAGSESFEQSSWDSDGLLAHSTAGDGQWTRRQGTTPSDSTGPNGASDGAHYLFTEASYHYDEEFILDVLPVLTASHEYTFQMWYHMYGSSMGTLSVEMAAVGSSTYSVLWSATGGQQTADSNAWVEVAVDLNPGTASVLIIRGATGSASKSDMAIDQVDLRDRGLSQSGTQRNGPARPDLPGCIGAATAVNTTAGIVECTVSAVRGGECRFEYELEASGPPQAVRISPAASGNATQQAQWPLSFDVEYANHAAAACDEVPRPDGCEWQIYSKVRPAGLTGLDSGVMLDIELKSELTMCYEDTEAPARVSEADRDDTCDDGKGEWVESEHVRICCREGATWCRKLASQARKELAVPPAAAGPAHVVPSGPRAGRDLSSKTDWLSEQDDFQRQYCAISPMGCDGYTVAANAANSTNATNAG